MLSYAAAYKCVYVCVCMTGSTYMCLCVCVARLSETQSKLVDLKLQVETDRQLESKKRALEGTRTCIIRMSCVYMHIHLQ